MNDDNQENRMRMRYVRYSLLSLAALLVLSLGFAFSPADPPAPPPPPLSEQARAAAFGDVVNLRAAGLELVAGAGDGGAAAAADRVVTLLTIQARALLLPEAAPASRPASASPPPSAPPSGATDMTVAELAAALAASGSERLKDAENVDGGMARLLAGAGTAQLLAAGDLAAAAGMPGVVAPAGQGGGVPGPPASGLPASGTPDSGITVEPCRSTQSNSVGLGSALAAAVTAEQEAVYGYQAALTRLPPAEAGPASEFLARHQDLAEDAEAYSRLYCGSPPPQPPGYVLEAGFLAAPAAGLARLEAATLPAYGDVVALADGSARAWALLALQSAAARTKHWGGDPGPVPGLALDEARLPLLPG